MGEVGDQLLGRLIQHARLGTSLGGSVIDPINPTATDVLFQFVLLNDAAKIRSGSHPIAFLNDSPIHVDEIQAAVGTGGAVDGAKVGIGRGNEFLFLVSIVHHNPSLIVAHFRASDQTSDRFRNDQVTKEVLRKSGAAKNGLAATPGEMVQRVVVAHPPEPALNIRHIVNRKDFAETLRPVRPVGKSGRR